MPRNLCGPGERGEGVGMHPEMSMLLPEELGAAGESDGGVRLLYAEDGILDLSEVKPFTFSRKVVG